MLQWLVATSRSVLSGSTLEGAAEGLGEGEAGEEEEECDEAEAGEFIPGSRGGLAASLTHVVVDEVHERSIDTDMVLLVLRLLLAASFRRHAAALRGAARDLDRSLPRGSDAHRGSMLLLAQRLFARRLRLVLMSATFDTTLFVEVGRCWCW